MMSDSTVRYIPKSTGATLIVLEQDNIRVFRLDEQESWSVGRNSREEQSPDISFDSLIVSRSHAVFRYSRGRWGYVDNPRNTNGTFLNGKKLEKTGRLVELKDGDILRIDNEDLEQARRDGVLMLFTTRPGRGTWSVLPLGGKKEITIGRSADCDLVEPLPYVSARQAKIDLVRGKYYISDCGSMSGTFLNGRAVSGSQPLREKDYISFGDCHILFLDGRLLYQKRGKVLINGGKKPGRDREDVDWKLDDADWKRNVVLHADIETKRVKNNSGGGTKELVRDIRLDIREGTLVALLGTAGAGKSTVMNCLNGMDLAGVKGQVLYRGVDLMKNFDQMKALIGSVPQKKTFHPSFTPEKEFFLAARKRLPADTTDEEIRARVEQTLQMLSMTGIRDNKNSKLSGGEQTRVNIGIELVADRDLLCLDEPDQGLSPNYKHELFQIMRDLAHVNGKSVLSIIHDVSEIDMFDQVIILAKMDGVGRLAFSGSPKEARDYFGVDIRDVYALLEREPSRFVK